MSNSKNTLPFVDLTANEVSSLWSSYLKNSMEQRLFEYFFASTEDNEVKQVIEKMLNQSQKNINGSRQESLARNITLC